MVTSTVTTGNDWITSDFNFPHAWVLSWSASTMIARSHAMWTIASAPQSESESFLSTRLARFSSKQVLPNAFWNSGRPERKNEPQSRSFQCEHQARAPETCPPSFSHEQQTNAPQKQTTLLLQLRWRGPHVGPDGIHIPQGLLS